MPSIQKDCWGFVWILRGLFKHGKVARGFRSLDSSVPLAELTAAWAGISCAIRDLGARSLIIEGDSITVIRWIRHDPGVCVPANPLIVDIQACLQGVHCALIRHVFREANSAADWIASRVADHSGFWSWNQGDTCPSILSQILYSDISGLTYPRMV